jgi:hypothetical protein
MATKKNQKKIRDLSIACALWKLGSEPRPLTVDSPAEDEPAQDAWDVARDVEADEARALLNGLDVVATLRVAADRWIAGAAAREVARAAQLRRFGRVVAGLHGFGIGWREMPQVSL